MTDSPGKKALIFIEDGSFLLDNRVQREAGTLSRAGWQVSVICPRYPGEKRYDRQGPIHVYRYRKWTLGEGFIGHVFEYASSLLKGGALSFWVYLKHGFQVFHACNPPDILFLLGNLYKVFGVRFLFDHHDLCPELYLSRFRDSVPLVQKALFWMESLTLKSADVVIATNQTYRRIEMERGGVRPERIFVVRNGPDTGKFRPGPADAALAAMGKTIVGYLGNMNPQDGVDFLVRAAHHLKESGRGDDLFFVFVGGGDAHGELRELSRRLGLEGTCRFTGRLPDDEMLAVLNACAICVQPDPSNPLNDASTMNKVMEYMALGKPVVAFDLPETRTSGGEAALYAEPNRIEDLAAKIRLLADDPELRRRLGESGRKRLQEHLCWKHSEGPLLAAYEACLRA